MSRLLLSRLRKRYAALALGVLLLGYPVLSHAQMHAEGIFGKIRFSTLLTPAAATSDVLKDIKLSDRDAILNHYKSTGDKPLWLGRGRTDEARAVLGLLEESWTHGLNPEKYHVGEIRALLDEGSPVNERQARLELLLTDAVVRYGRDVSGIRINPAPLGVRASFWQQPFESESILLKILEAKSPVDALRDLEPKGQLYKALRAEMARLNTEKNSYDHLLPMGFGDRLFKPGSTHKDVVALRARLGLAHNPDFGPETFYDDSLAAAVMAFQKTHNLKADGVIGPKTRSLLNRTNRDRMEQIVANLERMRWLDREKPERFILVNIPSQRLWAIDRGKIVHEMPVVVGQPSRQTKIFKAEIKGIRFNPTWTVPPGIKVKDMLPKLQADPYALNQKGIGLYQNGRSVDPASIDWANISRSELMGIRMVQGSGSHNALGHIRVLMPNDYDIYLHDTNHRELFANDERTLSSGCIRLSEPEKIASFVLSRNPDWSEGKMRERIDSGRTSEVSAAEPFPVYIVYQSVWLGEGGELVYGPDVYGQDRKLIDMLAAAKSYYLPESKNIQPSSLSESFPRLASSPQTRLN